MYAAFDALGLIEPVDIKIKLDGGASYDLPTSTRSTPTDWRPCRGLTWSECTTRDCCAPPSGSSRRWAMSNN
jgi:hypothetical protein